MKNIRLKRKQEFRARAEKERTEIKRSETDLMKLKNEFECLHNEIGTQNGGYAFEKWF